MYRIPGLTQAQLGVVYSTLRTEPQYEIRALLRLKSTGAHDRDLPFIADGEVNWAGPNRNASLTINDPTRRLLGDVEGLAASRYIGFIEYRLYVATLGIWVGIPLITGPLLTCIRNDQQVTMTMAGKAHMMRKAFNSVMKIPAGTKITDAITRIATEQGGEFPGFIRIANRPAQLHHDLTFTPRDFIWAEMVKLANSIDMLMFYDGGGTLRGHPYPTAPCWTFRTGNGSTRGWLTSMPQPTVNLTSIVNRVVFHYGPKLHEVVTSDLPDRNLLSAKSQIRNGVEQVYPEFHDNDKVEKTAIAQHNSDVLLRRANLEVTAVQGSIVPWPLLEAGDIGKFDSDDYSQPARIPNASMGLKPGIAMTFGVNQPRLTGAVA